MKKQIKQKQDDTQAKQNTNRNSDASANENRTPVSDETKQKLVKQYADRAEKESSKQNPVDWGYFNSPKFGSPVDERKQNTPDIPERRPSLLGGDGNPIDFVSQQPEALTHALYDDEGFLPSPRAEYSSGGRNALQNAQYYDSLGDYNRFFTQNTLNNEMSGPDANAIYYANGMTVPERNLINQIGNLVYNGMENGLYNQPSDDELVRGASILGQIDNRPIPRERNITGAADLRASGVDPMYGVNPMTDYGKVLSDMTGKMYGEGNINLYRRPRYQQPDGSVSTVNSMSFQDDNGQEVLIPTIAYDNYGNPVQLTDDEAIDRYYQTGEYLGKFNDPAEADAYAQRLHEDQERLYTNRRNPRDLW